MAFVATPLSVSRERICFNVHVTKTSDAIVLYFHLTLVNIMLSTRFILE